MSSIQISCSVVLYHNKHEEISRVINSFLNTKLNVKLYLIDNSSNDELKELGGIDKRIEYIFIGANIGYGPGHNIAISISIENKIPYHIVLNPDIYFNAGVIEQIHKYMCDHRDVGNVMPKILYNNGDLQYLCKLVPRPFDLIARRFIPFENLKKNLIEKYEMRFTGYDQIMRVPILSGCFMFLRTETLKKVGLFDERYFMYMEDVDLSRRIHKMYKNIFFPKVIVYHGYNKESYKSGLLLKYHIRSSISYFNKWGWLIDKERKIINKNSLKELNYKGIS